MAKKEKKMQKELEKALRKGNFEEMIEILKGYGGGKSVHVEFDDSEENKETEKKKKEEKKEKQEEKKSGLIIGTAPAAFDYRSYLDNIEKDNRKYERRMKKCRQIAEQQRDKILADNPDLDEEDIDIEDLAENLYEALYEKNTKSA